MEDCGSMLSWKPLHSHIIFHGLSANQSMGTPSRLLINPRRHGAWLRSLPTMLQELFQSNQEAHWRYQGCTPRQNNGKHLQQNVFLHDVIGASWCWIFFWPTKVTETSETLAVQPLAPEDCGNSTHRSDSLCMVAAEAANDSVET